MDWLRTTLQHHPEIALFATVAIGVVVGRLKYRGLTLGMVTATLLAGVLVGQWDVPISDNVRSVAFLLFIFAIGYKVGPQFFRALRSDGLPQVLFAVVVCVLGLGTAYVAAKILGFGPGFGAGLLAGSLTQSSIIGVAQDAIGSLPLGDDVRKQLIDQVPVGYAVTYVMGTVGVAVFLSVIAPRLMRIDLVKECAALEKELRVPSFDLDQRPAYYDIVFRSYTVASSSPMTVGEFEADQYSHGRRISVVRVRKPDSGTTVDARPETVLDSGDGVAVTSNRRDLVDSGLAARWSETDDRDLLGFRAETLRVVVNGQHPKGWRVEDLRDDPAARGVYVDTVARGGVELEWSRSTELRRGDELLLQGAAPQVEAAAAMIGRPVRANVQTDLLYLAVGIVVGALIGVPVLLAGGVSLSLTISGGVLFAGLVFGWARSRFPVFGYIPPGAQWLLDTGMLVIFVAVVGLAAGPHFLDGLRSAGLQLFFAGVAVTLIPQVVGLYIGRYVFRFKVPLLLGMLAGAQTVTAAVGVVQEQARSSVPVLGYVVPYAVSNTLLTVWGTLIVAFLA